MRSISSKILTILCLFAGGMAAIAQPVQLLNATNTPWRYMAPTTDPGFNTEWKDPTFGDSGPEWSTGIGLFGTETGNIAVTYTNGWRFNTVVPPVGNPATGPFDAFYRVHFNWASSTQGVLLTFTNLVDDGMVVFLNGTEIYRFNLNGLPGDPVVWAGAATSPTANPGGEPVMRSATVDPTAAAGGLSATLNQGDNVLAVYVGQAGATSSDTVFGMWLYGSQAIPVSIQHPPAGGTNVVVPECANVTLTVQATGIPAPTYLWRDPLGQEIVGQTGPSLTINNVKTGINTGPYTVDVTNPSGTVTSPPFNVSVNPPDTAGPVLVRATVNQARTAVTVSYNEPLAPPAPNDEFQFRVQDNLGGTDLNSFGALTLLNGTNIVVSLRPGEWIENAIYTLFDDGAGARDLCNNTPSPPNTSIQVTVPPSIVDIELRAAEPDTPRADAAIIEFDTVPLAHMLIKFGNIFGTGPGQIPPGTNIISAQLKLRQIDGGSAGNGHRMLIDWNAASTWNSLVNGVQNDGVEAAVAASFPFPNAANGDRFLDVTADIQAWANNPSSNFGWVLLPGGDDGLDIAASENADPSFHPQLIITTGPVSPVTITNQPVGLTTNEYATFTLSVGASGGSLQYQWQRAPHGSASFVNIPGATASTLTITNASAGTAANDAGDYRVIVSNNAPSSQTSAIAWVQITPDSVRPTAIARTEGDLVTIRVDYSEPVGASAATSGNYQVTGATVTGVTLTPNGMTALVTTTPRTFGATHTLTIQNVTDRAFTPNPLNPASFSLRSDISCFVNWNAPWRWVQDETLLDGSGWQTAAFDDSTWTESAGLFGLEPGTNAVLAPILPHAILSPWTIGAAQPTYYLRKQITVPPPPVAGAVLVMRHLIDDGALVYTNGVEAFRYGTNTGVSVFYTNYLQQPTGGDANLLSQTLTLAPGNHLIAVEVHQSGATSSDVLFGADFCYVLRPTMSISRTASGQNTLSWSPRVSTLEESTNLVNWTNSARANGSTAASGAAPTFYRIRM